MLFPFIRPITPLPSVTMSIWSDSCECKVVRHHFETLHDTFPAFGDYFSCCNGPIKINLVNFFLFGGMDIFLLHDFLPVCN